MQPTTTKYGDEICLPPTQSTKGEMRLAEILREINAGRIETGFSYPTPYRRNKFDIAVFAKDAKLPSLLVEYDGAPHDDIKFFRTQGNRPCRNELHVLESMRSDARKHKIAARFGAIVLRITDKELENEWRVKRLLATYVSVYVDNENEKSPEVGVMRMCEHHLPELAYVKESEPTRAVLEYLNERKKRGLHYIECDDAPCKKGHICPYNLYTA